MRAGARQGQNLSLGYVLGKFASDPSDLSLLIMSVILSTAAPESAPDTDQAVPCSVVSLPVEFRSRVWRGLDHFAIPLRRRLCPELFLAAHRSHRPEDCLLRQALFLAVSLEQDGSRQASCRLPGLKPGSIDGIIRAMSLPPALTDILARLGPAPLESDDYLTLALWSGITGASRDGRRMRRMLEFKIITTETIAVVATAPDDWISLLAGRSVSEIRLFSEALPQLLASFPSGSHAVSVISQCLRDADKDEPIAETVRQMISGRRCKGAFRAAPSFSDPRFSVITHPATISYPDLSETLLERILFEQVFLVGYSETDPANVTAFLLLEPLYAGNKPAGFVLHHTVFSGGGAADETIAARLREDIVKGAEVPVLLTGASRPTALETLLTNRREGLS